MQHVKTQESVFSDDVAAEKKETDFVADQGHGGNDVGTDGDGPKGELIPRKEVAGVAEKQRHQKKEYADDPIEFVRRFVATAVKDMEHVPENREHHQVSGEAVEVAEEDAVGYDELEVFHIAVGVRSRWVVVKHQRDTSDEKQDEEKKGNGAKIVGGADAQ